MWRTAVYYTTGERDSRTNNGTDVGSALATLTSVTT